MRRALLLLLMLGTCANGPQGPTVAGYTLAGELMEDETRLRTVLDSEIRPGSPWNTEKRKVTETLLDRLDYRLEGLQTRTTAEGVWLTLRLAPYTLVRHIEVEGNWPLLEDQVARRISLRRGSRLSDDPDARRRQLDAERERVREFLVQEGYFDSRVEVDAEKEPGTREATIRIRLIKGPSYTVGRVRVRGNTSIEDEDVIKARVEQTSPTCFVGRLLEGRLSPRCRFSREEHRKNLEDIQKLYQDRGFPRARVESTFDESHSPDRKSRTVEFTILIEENTRVDVFFEGNAKISEATLLREVTFAQEQAYDAHEIEASANAIRKKYQAEGYYQAVVTFERVRLLPNFERVVFYINEGPRLPVKSITFVGNRAFPADRLRSVIKTRELPGRVARLLVSGGYLTRVQLDQDREAIEQLYRSHGFAQAQVTAHVAPAPGLFDDVGALSAASASEWRKGGLYVQFRITEGPQDVVRRVQFLQNRAIPDVELEQVTRLKPASPYTEPQLEADSSAIRRAYANKGYPYASVSSERTIHPDHTVDVVHTIEEGPLVRYGEVLVRGNFRTKDWVIRDNLGFKPGDPFTLPSFEKSKRQLRTTGLFVGPSLDLLGFDTGKNPVHVVVNVKEAHDHHGVVEIGGGIDTQQLAFGNLGYLYPNIGGIGAAFVIRGEAGFQRQFGDATLTLPLWVMRHYTRIPLQLDISSRLQHENHDRFGDLNQLELRATFLRRLSLNGKWEDLQLSFGYAFRLFTRDEELTRPPGPDEDLQRTRVQTVTASVGPAIVLDRRTDRTGTFNPLNPARGYRLTMGAFWASELLGGGADFLKVSTSAQWFVPIGDRILLTNGLRYDHGIPLGGEVLLPEVERFFAGGDTTVRGFQRDRLKTEVIQSPLAPGSDVNRFRVLPAGGNIRFIHNIDLQLQVWDRSFLGVPFASGVFFDTGTVTNSFDGFGIDELRHSIGIALIRAVTLFGSLSLEYAVPLEPRLGEDPRGRFHFNLGFVFN